MRFNIHFTNLAKKCFTLLLLTFSSQVMLAYGQSDLSEVETSKLVKTDLQDKYYRQALFYYFQNNPAKALAQVEQSKAKLTDLDSRSALFEAGLQLSAGLLQPAKQTLINFDSLLEKERVAAEQANLTDDNDEYIEKHQKRAVKANELRLIALLSLTNQYLAQGDITQAKDTLARITSISALYYPEYLVLNQLAYWPQQNHNLLAKPEDSVDESSPYIQLNNALRLIELAQADTAQYDVAIAALQKIKITPWHDEESNFWKTLFIDDGKITSSEEQHKIAKLQGQAIQDYARLLLAQIYISQQQYDLAFIELKTFPSESPYKESALFLFAFASQQVEQYNIAFNLLNLLYKNYPYSPLGWQSAELMAQQVSEQQSLAQGVSAYQTIESFFLQRQKDLNDFALAFNQSDNLLTFSMADEVVAGEGNSTQYLPQSVWLQQALLDVDLASLYQGLTDIDEQTARLELLTDKTAWLAEIIVLNQTRKVKIVVSKKLRDEQGTFTLLLNERDRLAALLNKQLADEEITAFANDDERDWLVRIENSHNALNAIGDQRNTEEYKERLARVEGALTWQLAQQYPQRAWSHSKQLQQLNKAIADVTAQQKSIDKLSNNQDAIELSIQKHKKSEVQLNSLLSKLAQLRANISAKIRQKVNAYIADQKVILADHVLTTRQGMAKVLERMAQVDKRMEMTLAPTSNQPTTEAY
ncbi:hypothetical protein [Colwellia sp. E2M01]|uniref:tetratricopeptide repeat protein n=1 Tax=Colwellia sp. E2M01 TaxID=2841561 RepID=UPI001C084101|nr:hypothetical protein [Colwellia sp. E2M01]MBU2870784.1 hypothetical protein [Colwellia sp. E2M01]